MNSSEDARSTEGESAEALSPSPSPAQKPTDDADGPYGEISLASMKSIEIYQNQVQIVDRLWAYFSQYSGLLVVLGLGLVAFRSTQAVSTLHWGFTLLPLLAYVAFCVGNHRAMTLTLQELQIVRSVAISKTRLAFSGHATGTILRFQLLMILLVLLAYTASAWYAMNEGDKTAASNAAMSVLG